MREDEFEKRVRDKMEHLGFEPSESVWTGVDKEINKEKKRRLPLFWLFFASGLFLAGSAYYVITNKNTEEIVAKIPDQEKNAKKQVDEQAMKPMEPQKIIQENTNDHAANDATGTVNEKMHFSSTGSKSRKLFDHSGGQTYVKKETRRADGETNENNESGHDILAAGTADIVINNYSNKSTKAETEKANQKIFDSTAGKMISGEKENKSKKDSVISTATVKNKEEKKKASSWTWGLTGGAGSSNLHQDLFNSVKTLAPVSFQPIQ